jgi:NitT/TauT family transport system ATP-binding protein
VYLELVGLSKTYPGRALGETIPVLEDLNCRLEAGKFISFVGPSGCGKTTLLRIISGLEPASSGQVLLNGQEITPNSQEIGFVFQEYALFPWRTTLENITLGPEIQGVPKKERRIGPESISGISGWKVLKTITRGNSRVECSSGWP